MAEPQDDYFDRVYAESSEEDRKVLDQGTPDFFRELKYGFERATFMGADIARLAEAETSGKTIQEIEAERLGRIEARYSDLPKASKESYTALGGELLGEVLDPTLIGLGPLGFAAKGTKLGKLGQRVYSSVYGGGLYGSDAAIDMAARGEDISAAGVAVGALAGTLGGAFIKPVVKKSTSEAPATIKLETTADDAFSLPITQVSDEQEVAIKKVFADVDASNPSIMESLADLPNMGARVAKARETRLRYKEEYANRKAKRAGALSKDELAKLRKERDSAREDMRTLPTEMMRNSEIISDAFLESATRLDKQGLLNENTIGRIVTRPLIGAGIGYGLGVTNQAITGEEDSLSPMWFVTAGLIGGQLSKKIMNSKFSTSVKEEGLKSLEELNNRSLAAQANLLFSGTTAARLNTLGDDVSAFGRTLLAQRGADLKGAATVSVEEAKDIAAQELNNVFSKSMMGLGVLGKDNDEIRKAAWKYSEGFADEATLLSRGFSKAEVETVKQLSDEAKAIVSSVTNEAESVGLQFLKLEDYALPQLHDFAKIGADLDTAKAAYRRAFIKQARADRVSATLLKDPNADVSKINLSEKQIGAASDAADKWVMDAATLGLPGGRVKSAWQAKTPAEREMFNTRLTPLADHFEKDRVIKDLEARREIQDFLVQDVAEIIPQYVDNSMPIIEFGRAFGSRGEVIFELKKAINTEAEAAKRAAKGDKRLYVLADKVRRNKIKAIHDSVEMYFGTYQASNRLASSGAATNALGLLTTLGNTTMLTKVTLDSMGDMVQPFVNSGFWNSIKGMKRTNSKEMTDFAESTGFAQRDVLSQELRSLMLDRNNALSVTQRGIAKSNEIFFKTIGLAKLTSYARRFAYNTGIEDAFNIAQDVAKKGMTKTNLNKAKALGLSDDAISTLQRFKNVDEAFDDVDGKKILNIAGIKTADRDVLIPQVGNRLGFTQSKDPLIRSLGQFLSWAQAKTTQTNAIVQRIEDGDVALGVRALGSLVVYDGIMTFKQYLNDPTGKYLPDEVDSYVEKLITPEQLGSAVIQGGFSPFYAQKAASLIFTPYGSTVTSNISPTISLMEDLGELVFESTPRNLEQEDYEGLALQYLRRIPFGKEVEDILAVTGNELEDVGKQSKGKATESSFVPLYNKGGEVLDVPNVPTEPDQRIDKMTGLPYDQQAGTAFVDEEDPLRRLGFKGGGEVDPLSRLGFGLGSLVSKGFAKLTDDAADVSEEAFKKEMDDLAGAIDKGETPKMFEEPSEDLIKTMDAEDARVAATMTVDDIAVWQKENTIPESQRQKQRPEIAEQLVDVLGGRKTIEEYRDTVDELFPPSIYTKENAPKFPTLVEVRGGVGKKTTTGGRGIIGADVPLEEGRRVASRLDIPAYDNRNVWAVTVHKPGKSGTAIAYGQTAILKNVDFNTDPKTALDIALGQNKGTIARIEGDWVNHNPRQTYEKAIDLLESDEWVQVGMNPFKHSYFYDKATMQPVVAAEEVIQVGPLVLVKKEGIKYASPDDEMFKIDLTGLENTRSKAPLNTMAREGQLNIDETRFGLFGFGKKDTELEQTVDTIAEDLVANTEGKELKDVVSYVGSKSAEAGKEDYKLISEKVAAQLDNFEKEGFSFNYEITRLKKGSDRDLERPAPAALVRKGAAGVANLIGKDKKVDVYINDLNPRDSLSNGLNYETILHESIHAATMSAIKVGNLKSQAGTKLFKDVQDLYSLFNYVIKQFNEKAKNPESLNEFESKTFKGLNNTLQNPDELVSWGLTNSEMQKYLEGIKYGSTNAWTAFVIKIREILGLSSKEDTALSELLRVSDELLTADVKQITSVLDGLTKKNSGGRVLKALTRKKYSFGNEVRADMRRADGSVKSPRGYLGPVENTVQGGTMTEVSIGTEINGKKMEIPTMVPTLTKDEVKALSSMKLEGNAKNIPESIIMKAKEHARMRLEQGKNPFYQDGE